MRRALLVVTALLILCGYLAFQIIKSRNTTELVRGPRGGDFSIPSTQGIFNSESVRGKKLFLFFGFTHCPHICPMTLTNLETMVKALPESERDQAVVLFVSVDNKRDTIDNLKKYFQNRPKNFVAATDTDEKLKELMAKFGAAYNSSTTDSGMLTFDHSTQVFVINSKGEWVHKLRFGARPEEFVEAFRTADDLDPIYTPYRVNRNIEVIGENNTCDLAKTSCSITIDENENFELSLGPMPILHEKNLEISLKTNSMKYIPTEIDFQGVALNMGYIRPSLEEVGKGQFSGDLYLPTCELRKMKWIARLILKGSDGSEKSLLYYFESINEKPL